MAKRSKEKIFIIKILIIIVSFIIIINLFQLILARYESITSSKTEIDLAIYLLNVDYKTMTINLDDLLPQNDAYVYNFSIGNEDGTHTSEIDMTYNLSIRTTTNLPLTYELYMNQNYTDEAAENIITSNTIEQDEYNTYFRKIATNPVNLYYTTGTTNNYQLVVKFPETYNTTNYQNILEMIEITVDSKQMVD